MNKQELGLKKLLGEELRRRRYGIRNSQGDIPSQAELASKVGRNQPWLSEVESGRSFGDLEAISVFCRQCLSCSLGEVIAKAEKDFYANRQRFANTPK